MGRIFQKTCSLYDQESNVIAPNPNPINFKILKVEEFGRNLVAQIAYPDCINFEGIKICVFKDMSKIEIESLYSIDPHFSEGSQSPFARFKPNKEGWQFACILARNI